MVGKKITNKFKIKMIILLTQDLNKRFLSKQ